MRFLKILLLASCLLQILGVHAQGIINLKRPSRTMTQADFMAETKLLDLVRIVRHFYVDSINNKEIVDKAIVALLQELDPHSYYLPPEQHDETVSELSGHFYGVGIEFAIQKDTLVVVATIPDTPAERVGIRSGDKFLTVDGENIASVKLTNSRVAKYLRGAKGSSVSIDVLRDRKVEKYTLVRDSIPLHSVDVAYQIAPSIGYLRITRFAETTTLEFLEALKRLKKEGTKSYILDFRGNPGGLMQPSIQMASAFLPEGSLIVYVKGRRAGRQDFEALPMGKEFTNVPLVVLVDEFSASASEIFTGALQDWDRAVVVGRRTFGKGLVQNQFAFQDSSFCRITIARYYTPSNRLIQTPYKMGEKAQYNKSFVRRYENGELFHKDSIHFPDSLRYTTLRTHRTVYGGGGIMPDIFIPRDTTVQSEYVNRLLRNGLIRNWVMDYVTTHRDSLEKIYPSISKYLDNYTLSVPDRTNLVAYSASNGVKIKKNETLSTVDIAELEWYCKIFVARSLYSFESMHRVLHQRDEEVKCALDLLKNWKTKGREILDAPKTE
ncbi:MAG: S41 family peptidase [Bacteroides sp.]